jgi:hypothetical protein
MSYVDELDRERFERVPLAISRLFVARKKNYNQALTCFTGLILPVDLPGRRQGGVRLNKSSPE